ncbi:MAG: hypothetical protein Q8902_06020 [Bacteroidota bacterium]|nr:hypothetical protein [Bacteroidota bacterium]MDP4233849.1 hypothetical protein [Bacteroidota bacterium]MDP4242452.1 hypothetical protein [Bacteroidota bacterium]
MTRKSLQGSILFIIVLAVGGCSDLPTVDQYFTFNVVRTVDFSIPNSIMPDKDTGISATGKIDTTKDYQLNGTAAYLLRSAKITRIQLVPSDPTLSLSNLSYARLVIGMDTVGDSMYVNDKGEYLLNTAGRDVTQHVRDTSYSATLYFSLRNPISSPATITTYLTFVNTALPQ